MSTQPIPDDKNLPIRYVAQATGVLPVTLRAWERRYGLLKPARTDKGHRLYSETDIITVRQIVALIRRGIPIGRARAMLDGKAVQPAQKGDTASDWPAFRRQLAAAAAGLDNDACLTILRRAGQLYPLHLLAGELIRPADRIISQGVAATAWAARQLLAQACAVYLEQRARQTQAEFPGSPVLIAGLSRDELFPGGQLFAAGLREAGIDARWLGPMPGAACFAEVLREHRALAGIIWEDGEPVQDWEAELRQMQRLRSCFVIVGGELVAHHATSLQAIALPVLSSDPDEAVALLNAIGDKTSKGGTS